MTLAESHNQEVLAALVFVSIIACIGLLFYYLYTRRRQLAHGWGWSFFFRHRMGGTPAHANMRRSVSAVKSGGKGSRTGGSAGFWRFWVQTDSRSKSRTSTPDLEKGQGAETDNVEAVIPSFPSAHAPTSVPTTAGYDAELQRGPSSDSDAPCRPPPCIRGDTASTKKGSSGSSSGNDKAADRRELELELGMELDLASCGSDEWLGVVIQRFPLPPASSSVPSVRGTGVAVAGMADSGECQSWEKAEPDGGRLQTNIGEEEKRLPSVQSGASTIKPGSFATANAERKIALTPKAPAAAAKIVAAPGRRRAEDWAESSFTEYAYL